MNWNHPNIHCTSDPYYQQWNKGFKLRILLDQYAQFGAFAFRTKAETLNENRRLQRQTHTAENCEERDFHITPSTVHPAENDDRLPEEIKGGHYIHFRHFCAVLGCEHAPCEKIRNCFSQLGDIVIPFPILCKDTNQRIEEIINNDTLLANRQYRVEHILISHLLSQYNYNPDMLVWGTNGNNGYPISEIVQAIAYVIADENELFGKRPKGYLSIIERHINLEPETTVEVRIPDLLTPLVVLDNGRGALIGARNPEVYRRLITVDPNNQYKLLVRPITEEDLRNA